MIYDHIALIAPAVRCVVVKVIDHRAFGRPGVEHEFLPVLALQASVVNRKRLEHTALVPSNLDVYQDDGLCDFQALRCSNVAVRLVACPWHPEEDADRLAEVVDELVAELDARHKAPKEDVPAKLMGIIADGLRNGPRMEDL